MLGINYKMEYSSLDYELLKVFREEAIRLEKDPVTVIDIWSEAYEEDKRLRGSGIKHFDIDYDEFMLKRREYQIQQVEAYLYGKKDDATTTD